MSGPIEDLKNVAADLRPCFAAEDEARENALKACRQVIRHSGDAIRAVHLQDQDRARRLLSSAHELLRELSNDLTGHGRLLHSGFIHDAQKELAEAYITLALIGGEELPGPGNLEVSNSAYLIGLGESVGELRRYILDSLRRDDFSRCEELLGIMEEVHGVLMTMDFPELLAHGLRRNTDTIRGIIERTRGDLTVSLRQRALEARIDDVR